MFEAQMFLWRMHASCCLELSLDSTVLFLIFAGFNCLCVFLPVCCRSVTAFAWCWIQVVVDLFACVSLQNLSMRKHFATFAGFVCLWVILQPLVSDSSLHLRFTSYSQCGKLKRMKLGFLYCLEVSLDSTLLFLVFAGFNCLRILMLCLYKQFLHEFVARHWCI